MKKPAFNAIRSSAQAGFTLIELIVVIVILGILAATALPKFASMSGDARVAALNAARGALQTTVSMVHGQSLLSPGSKDFTNEGAKITVVNGYPDAASVAAGAGLTGADYKILTAKADATDTSPVVPDKSAVIIPKSIADTASSVKCYLTYTEAADANTPPVVALPVTATADNCK
ncbi:MAG: prepilin-type N-terminal cleavage/methylation domain-containing protein [Pseudomonadota bacterium]